MKKLLSVLAAAGLSATTFATVVACAPVDQDKDDETPKEEIKTELDVLNTVISDQEDIKNIVHKNWTYSSFFNMNGEKDEDKQDRILDLFYPEVKKSAKENLEYDTDKINDFHKRVMTWSKDAINLGYVGEDKEFIKITAGRAGQKTLETIFLEYVKAEFPDTDLDKDFWKDNKSTLAINFDSTIPFGEDQIKDDLIWTFTFKTE